jgi:ElaB/YqjD/DUF883 family membrane-anchored ribosome-binding protein
MPDSTTMGSTTMGQSAQRVADSATDAAQRLRDDLQTIDQRVRQLLHEYPLTSVFLAIASGYLVGRLASRR